MSNPTIFLSPSGNIAVEIQHELAGNRTRIIEIPQSLAGLSALKTILVARQRAAKAEERTLGTQASPVASDIQKFIAQRESQERAAAAKIAKDLTERFDVEGIDLEL